MTIADNIATSETSDRSTPPGDRLILVQIGTEDWLIHDTAYPENDARRLVACVRERGLDHVDVIWLQGTGLPTRFARVADAQDAAVRAVASHPKLTPARPENWLG